MIGLWGIALVALALGGLTGCGGKDDQRVEEEKAAPGERVEVPAGGETEEASADAHSYPPAAGKEAGSTPAGATRSQPVALDYFTQAQPAPDFTLENLEGTAVSLSDFRGKVVLLDFWATWCPPCRKEIPHLKELHTEYGDDGLVILGIALDVKGRRVVAPFVEEHQLPYPIVLGGQEVSRAYGGVRNIPTAFLIDRDGLIRRRYVGYQDKDVFERDLRVLLSAA